MSGFRRYPFWCEQSNHTPPRGPDPRPRHGVLLLLRDRQINQIPGTAQPWVEPAKGHVEANQRPSWCYVPQKTTRASRAFTP